MMLSGSSRTAGGYGLPLSLALAAPAVALLVVFFVVPLSTLLREPREPRSRLAELREGADQ